MQPELSHWDPKHAFEFDESFSYYQKELCQIIKALANHPSFVMLTFGNELHCGALGTSRMHKMLQDAKNRIRQDSMLMRQMRIMEMKYAMKRVISMHHKAFIITE